MIPRRILNATHVLGAPSEWDAEKNGKCHKLAVRVKDKIFESAWEPTPEEIEAIVRGASVVLSVYGGQPPVRISVE